MQFDRDIQGKFADVFMYLRAVILCFDGVSELKNEKQTSYRDEYGRVVCILRTDDEKLTLVLAQGAKLESRYPFLEGNGKIVRHLYFLTLDEVDDALIKDMIEESMVLNMEAVELKKLQRKRV